jgi:hypothetical protein
MLRLPKLRHRSGRHICREYQCGEDRHRDGYSKHGPRVSEANVHAQRA